MSDNPTPEQPEPKGQPVEMSGHDRGGGPGQAAENVVAPGQASPGALDEDVEPDQSTTDRREHLRRKPKPQPRTGGGRGG